MTEVSNQEAATETSLDLIEATENPAPTDSFASIGYRKLQAIRNLEDIFKQTTTPQ